MAIGNRGNSKEGYLVGERVETTKFTVHQRLPIGIPVCLAYKIN